MATSTRPRRAAAPASAEHPARSDDSAAKKPAAKKAPAKKTVAAEPAAAKRAPAGRQAAARKVAAPAEAAAPAAKKVAAKPAPAKKRPAAREAAPATAEAPAMHAPMTEAAKPAAKRAAARPAANGKPTTKRPAAQAPAVTTAAGHSTSEQSTSEQSTSEKSTSENSKPHHSSSGQSTTGKRTTAEKSAAKGRTTRKAGAEATTADAMATTPAPAGRQPAAKKTTSRRAATRAPEAEAAALPYTASVPEASALPPAAPLPETPPAAAPVPAPASPAAPAVPAQPHSAVVLQDGDHRQLRWIAGSTCPQALHAAATSCTDEAGLLQLDNDDALPTLLREAAAAGHALQVDPAAWQQLARRRDARQRLFVLEHAYPEGPASAALHDLLRAPLAPFQAEGALFAACAGRALLADERGLGKTVQALAAAVLLHRHAGVERVLIHCSADQRLSWQREAARFLGARAPEWRVVSDEPGGPHAETIDAWKPGLVVIDEPARLARWDRIDAPFALVLCGTPLEDDAALTEALVDYLDRHREGPLARLRSRTAGDALDDTLQALMLRRRRADVTPQLPARVASERVIALGPLQRAVHDRAAASARAVLAAWRRTRHLTDAQQWELGSAMQAMREACHRAEPGQPDSPLAEHTLSALDVLTSELLGHADVQIAVVAPRGADAAQLADRLARAGARCTVVAAGAPLPDEAEVVIAIGMPWRTPPADARPRHWIHLVAEQSIDTALYDTRELREGIASTPAEGGHHGFLHGAALQRYLLAVEAALHALPTAAAPGSGAG